MNFGVSDFSRFEVTDWRLRRWRLCFLALMTATRRKRHRRIEAVPLVAAVRLSRSEEERQNWWQWNDSKAQQKTLSCAIAFRL